MGKDLVVIAGVRLGSRDVTVGERDDHRAQPASEREGCGLNHVNIT